MLYDCCAHCNRVSANFGARCPCNTSNGYFFDLSPLTLIVSLALQGSSKMVDNQLETPKIEDSVKKHFTYMITDGLEISPNSIVKSISIRSKAKVEKMSDLTSMEISVTPRQILQLLKAALISQAAPSSVFEPLITLKLSSVEDPLRNGLCQGNSEGSVEESPIEGTQHKGPMDHQQTLQPDAYA